MPRYLGYHVSHYTKNSFKYISEVCTVSDDIDKKVRESPEIIQFNEKKMKTRTLVVIYYNSGNA